MCYNCEVLGNYQRDYPNSVAQCTYCSAEDHTVEEFPQLLRKWKAKNTLEPQPNQNANQTQNQNPGLNVGNIFV